MLTLALYAALAVVLMGGIFLLITRVLPAGERIAPPVRDEPIWTLPAERWLTADEVSSVRLPVAVRGYRFAEADELLDRLAHELAQRDEEITRLRGGSAAGRLVGQPARPDPGAAVAGRDPDDGG